MYQNKSAGVINSQREGRHKVMAPLIFFSFLFFFLSFLLFPFLLYFFLILFLSLFPSGHRALFLWRWGRGWGWGGVKLIFLFQLVPGLKMRGSFSGLVFHWTQMYLQVFTFKHSCLNVTIDYTLSYSRREALRMVTCRMWKGWMLEQRNTGAEWSAGCCGRPLMCFDGQLMLSSPPTVP